MFQPTNFLSGNIVSLKQIPEEDIDRLLEIENLETNRLFADDELPLSLDKETLKKRWDSSNDDVLLGIYTKDNLLIGSCCMYQLNQNHSHCEIGLIIDSDWHNQGIGYETLELLTHFLFDYLPINKIKLEVFAFNEGAIHLYEKFGFTLEGRLRQEIFRFGHYHDLLTYGLLRSEFEENKQK